jgi:hypothetical protein
MGPKRIRTAARPVQTRSLMATPRQPGLVHHLGTAMYYALNDLPFLISNRTYYSFVITGQSTQTGRKHMIFVAKLVPETQTARRGKQLAETHQMVSLLT